MKRLRRLASRFDLGGRILRRPIDRLAARGVAGLLTVFVVGAPLLAVAGGSWTEHAVISEQRTERSWHLVTAELTRQVPVQQNFAGGVMTGAWVTAKWQADGHTHTHLVPITTAASAASAATAAGRTVQIWVNKLGQWSGPPLTAAMGDFRVIAAMLLPFPVLGLLLIVIGLISRLWVNRRRLAFWDDAWAAVGPQWTREFWAKG
jgi:hypothetical protein